MIKQFQPSSRSSLKLFFGFLLLFLSILTAVAPHAFAANSVSEVSTRQEHAYTVEFIVGDRVDPTRKWGHVSLRVVGNGQDTIFDFGRYGRMWNKDAEGDPILRIWQNKLAEYMRYQRGDGGSTYRYVFQSSHERNQKILDSFDQVIRSGRLHSKDSRWTAYVIATRSFHAVDFNCTTVAIDAFHQGFPEYDLHVKSYSKARTLGFFLRGFAQNQGRYDGKADRWPRIWWPLDLRAALQDLYVKRGIAGKI